MNARAFKPDAASTVFATLVITIAGVPIATALGSIITALPDASLDIRWVILARTLAWAAGIGALATLLALPIAFATRGLTARWSPLAALPLLMPMPLVYAGLNLFRAPGTVVGDWLAMGPSWRAIAAGRVVAVLGLALWSTPIAAAVLASGVRSIDRSLSESTSLEGAGPIRRALTTLAAMRSSLIAATAVVAVVMTGSAIPLHLAQINTYSITLWLELDAAATDARGTVWLAAVPILVISCAASLAIARLITRAARAPDDPLEPPRARLPWQLVALTLIALGSIAPLALFARELSTLDTFAVLWRTEKGAVSQSALVAGVVALTGVLIAWTTRVAVVIRPCLTALGLALLLSTALAPGVLVGSAIGSAWSAVPAVADTPAVLILAHLARLAALAALLGVLIAAAEPRSRRDARALEGATGLFTSLRASGDALLSAAVGIALAAMSLGEIEASIMVQPPGGESVARSMLNMLHFARYEHLSGLVLLIATPAATLGAVAWLVLALGRTLHHRRTLR
ncbi:MAG: hypothetical protein AAFO89_05670 [Planctomycetota bacterium]